MTPNQEKIHNHPKHDTIPQVAVFIPLESTTYHSPS